MSKIYNLENQHFGNLHVIQKAPKDKTKKKNCTRWICECKCGNISTVTTSDLINGRTTQCRECALKDVGLKNWIKKEEKSYRNENRQINSCKDDIS